jgi:hypothetical protein
VDELFIRFVVAVDQCVSLVRRKGKEFLIGLFALVYLDSLLLWQIAWMGAAFATGVLLMQAIAGDADDATDSGSEGSAT